MSLFEISERAQRYQSDLLEFMDSHVYPSEAVYAIASQELRKYRDG